MVHKRREVLKSVITAPLLALSQTEILSKPAPNLWFIHEPDLNLNLSSYQKGRKNKRVEIERYVLPGLAGELLKKAEAIYTTQIPTGSGRKWQDTKGKPVWWRGWGEELGELEQPSSMLIYNVTASAVQQFLSIVPKIKGNFSLKYRAETCELNDYIVGNSRQKAYLVRLFLSWGSDSGIANSNTCFDTSATKTVLFDAAGEVISVCIGPNGSMIC